MSSLHASTLLVEAPKIAD